MSYADAKRSRSYVSPTDALLQPVRRGLTRVEPAQSYPAVHWRFLGPERRSVGMSLALAYLDKNDEDLRVSGCLGGLYPPQGSSQTSPPFNWRWTSSTRSYTSPTRYGFTLQSQASMV